MFTLKQLMDERRRFSLPLFLRFVDLKKADDTMDENKLWAIPQSCNTDKVLVNGIRRLYTKQRGSQTSEVNMELRQGCGSCAVLCNVYTNEVTRLCPQTAPKRIKIGKGTVKVYRVCRRRDADSDIGRRCTEMSSNFE